ncbi:1,4-alpha-glucan-branching enzyme [Trema orientale]|uniref:1,4-alpha-glucan-branching enzyme n=1 Tax=Trema orientale TaxID=63057 RepID=A0A2P5F4R1_TREOI|nr:1,4-alpha-glucan-branching enzyme [Trema orientale]
MAILLTSYCSTITVLAGTLPNNQLAGNWRLLKRNIGISAMHMAVLPNERVIVFDRTNFGPSNITKKNCPTTKDGSESESESESGSSSCYAHSVEFDPSKRTVRPLTILTDTWCSSGALSHDGVLIQSGGYERGERVVRYFSPCTDCDWVEDPNGLVSPRWYASNQVLNDGKIIVVGGRYQFSYEFIPKKSGSDRKQYGLPFLKETRYLDTVPNNLYPFLHLSPDGNLFIFANDRGILLDYVNNKVVRRFAAMPGGFSRNYPSTGSSALLALNLSGTGISNGGTFPDANVLVCGGTLPESNVKAVAGEYLPATRSCGRLTITKVNPKWEMEEMPIGRVMGDMILLPTGDVLIINGAGRGTAGWDSAREPVLNPVIYRPGNEPETRFEVLAPSTIPRLYHSTAHLLSDGRVLVGGSNPNRNYNFSTLFPTELSLEAFYPPYFSTDKVKSRPLITSIKPVMKTSGTTVVLNYKQRMSVHFRLKYTVKGSELVYVTMVAPSFTTHSFAMNQRLLVLDMGELVVGKGKSSSSDSSGSSNINNYMIQGYVPATSAVAPPGYYMLFVVVDGVPSRGMWVRMVK